MPLEIIRRTWSVSQGWYEVTTENSNITASLFNEQLLLSHYVSYFITIPSWASFHIFGWVLLVCKLSFWCLHNKFLLITISVIHWFLVISELFTANNTVSHAFILLREYILNVLTKKLNGKYGMEVLANAVVIILQHLRVSNQHAVRC